jgi:23S rRNA pseudouridine2605 synthase
MADKKPSKRSGAPGGDRPMRRRDPKTATRDDARKTFDSDRPKFEKPRGEKAAQPRTAAKRARPAPAPVEKTSAFEGERIAKAMARAGVCSRRDAEQWIAEGRVAVNGKTLTNPAVNVTEADKITIDGAPMQARERTRLFLFHKPQGLVTTASDPEGRPTVFAYLEEKNPDLPRLVSVGRLDINTEGLLLLTNDGGLARTLELPATGWTRRYRVRVHGETDQARLDELKGGVTVDDVAYAPIEARLERVQGANAWIAMSLTEGKNREVKRVMEHLGLDVNRLIRVSYGPFQLGELAEGAIEEVKLKVLRDQLGKSLAELAGVDFASPLREATPAEKQEQRVKVEKRARKHVSLLRKQRDEQSETGPRARIERSATADRKGRAVAVERVTPTRRKAAVEGESASCNAKRFDAMRAGARRPRDESAGDNFERPARSARGPREERFGREEGGRRAPAGRPGRFEEGRSERPARAPRERGEERRDARPRGERSFERGETRGRAGEGRNYRSAAREEAGFEKRPPRRDRDDARPDTRAPRGGGGERSRKFDSPRGERDFAAGERAPRRRDGAEGRPPRGDAAAPQRGPRGAAGKGPARSGARSSGGPAPGANPGRGPGRGSSKGPNKGPGRGAPKGPRKPRGA